MTRPSTSREASLWKRPGGSAPQAFPLEADRGVARGAKSWGGAVSSRPEIGARGSDLDDTSRYTGAAVALQWDCTTLALALYLCGALVLY